MNAQWLKGEKREKKRERKRAGGFFFKQVKQSEGDGAGILSCVFELR